MNIIDIRFGSKWILLEPNEFIANSHSNRPSGDRVLFDIKHVLTFEDVAPNGNVWFVDEKYGRVKIECGCITNLLKRGIISPLGGGNFLYCRFDKSTSKIVY